MITTSELFKKYGTPTESGSPYLTKLILPYPMVLSWDKGTKINSLRCHKLVSGNLKNVFDDLLKEYGLANIQRLGIDLYGGCFAFRKMRGGTDWSRHSWGIAIDLDPERIFYKHGFLSLGVEKDYDWMHFEIGS